MPPKIGRYEIKSQVGHGGMATVYHAFDPRFKRDVALKVMQNNLLESPNLRARFEREAQTIAALEHPAIVPVYDFGEEENRLYLVMRLMTGGTLADRLSQGPLNVADTVTILERIGSALERAHSMGIIHRDLKPSNVLFDQYGDAFLGDFGIARLTESSVTLTGEAVIGTPAYMSPEQVYGDKTLDGRSDIYALGVICFEMLTGQPPYRDDTPARVMMKHVMDPVPSIHQVKPDLPPAFEEIINRAMAKEPDARYATASEITQSLHDTARSLPPVAAPPVSQPASETPVETATSLAATELAAPDDLAARTETADPPPVTPAEPATGGMEVAATVVSASTPPASPTAHEPAASRRPKIPAWGWAVGAAVILVLLLGSLALFGLFSGSDDDDDDTGSDDSNALVEADNEPDETGDESDDGENEPGREDSADIDALTDQAFALAEQEEYENALAVWNEVINLNPEEAWYYYERGSIYHHAIEDFDAALSDFNKAIELEPDEGYFYISRGTLYRDLNDIDMALADHLQAVNLNPTEPDFHMELGATYEHAGDLDKALVEYNEAITISPDSSWYYQTRAYLYFLLGEMTPAMEDYNAAIALEPDSPWLYMDRGILRRDTGDIEGALEDFTRAVALDASVAWFYQERGYIYRDYLDQPLTALGEFTQAVEADPSSADLWAERASVYTQLEEYDAAFSDLAECLRLDPDYYWCYWDRAWLYDTLGDSDAATADFERFLATVYEDDCLECQEDAQTYIQDHQ